MSKKVKYNWVFKLKAVQKVEQGHALMPLAESLGIGARELYRWIGYYNLHGIDGLKPHKNHYTTEFKIEVIKAYHSEGLSLGQTCLRFHIPSRGTLKGWLSIYDQEGIEGLGNAKGSRYKRMAAKKRTNKKTEPLTREQELEKQLEELKLENLFLKKLNALIQKEERLKGKKP